MFIATPSRSLLLVILLLFSSAAGAQQQLTPTGDDSAWRALVTGYFLTYAKRDIEGVLSLWSAQSPELAAERKTLGETFAAHEKIELKDVAVRRATVEGETVSVRAVVEMRFTKKGESESRGRRMNRVLHFVREAAAWRVWGEEAAEKQLAASLAAAKTDEERQRLLTEEHELLSVELRAELVQQAERLRGKGSYAQALGVLDVARRVAEQIDDKAGVAAALRGIGTIQSRLGNYAQAAESHRKSLALFESLGDKAGMAGALNNIGNVHRVQGDYAQAADYFQKSLTLAEASDDKSAAANALNNIGLVRRALGDYAQAVEYYRKSMVLREAVGDKAGIATTLNNIGNVHQARGDYGQAAECFQQSLALRESLSDKAGVAGVLSNLGLAHQSRGDYEQAAGYYRKSLALSEALDDKPAMAGTLNNVGIIYQLQGDYAEALEYYQKSLALSEALGDKSVMARTLNNIGIVHRAQINYAQAVEYFQKSMALKEAVGDKAGIAVTLGNIGTVHQRRGDYARATECFQKSLALAESLGNKAVIASALNYIGEVHQAQGDYEQAAGYYRKSLTLKETLDDKEGMARTLNNIGELYQQQGRHAQALEFAGRAAALARPAAISDELWHSQLIVGRANASLDRPGPARQALTDSIQTIETMRAHVAGAEQDSQRFFENKLSPYLAMAELLIRQNNPEEALTYAERAKARVLLDVLRGGRVNINKAMTAPEQAEEHQLTGRLVSLNSQFHRESLLTQPDKSRLDGLRAQLDAARLDYEATQTRLYAAHPELKIKRGEAPPLKLDEAASLLLDTRSALLEYMVTEEKTYLFVLTRSGDGREAKAVVQVFPLNVTAKELAERASNFRRQLAGRDLLYRQTAGELYELLLGPARNLLKGRRLLTIVPDGMLWEMPFQALQPTPGRHLIEESAVAYAPSLTVLREMKRAPSKARSANEPMSLLAVGNPLLGTQSVERLKARMMVGELLPLPEAEEQVKGLQRLYGAEHSTVYVGADAREERVKADAGKYRILHLATHGIFDDASPMYSQVVLAKEAGGAREDGFLEAWEIMNLDLHADLVVLSACETARGRVGAGEGMIGLAWALFVAGTPSTVVSQWQVDAASTNTLMLEFHRSLRAGNSKARALQQATLKILQDRRYRHPFYWAPFVLIGDAN